MIEFTNGRVTITKVPVLGLFVLVQRDDLPPGEDWPRYEPLAALAVEEFEQVERALDHNPTFPWWDEFWAVKAKLVAA